MVWKSKWHSYPQQYQSRKSKNTKKIKQLYKRETSDQRTSPQINVQDHVSIPISILCHVICKTLKTLSGLLHASSLYSY